MKTRLPVQDLALWALIVCAAFVAYSPALHGSLLWDDDGHVTRAALQSVEGLFRIWFDLGATQQYYPLLHTAFWAEHAVWGDAVFGYHAVNVALHAASACLVVLVARRLKLNGAWIAGLLFALHPICVEAVAWISEQKSTLSGLFYLGAALAYLGFDDSRKRSRYVLALALFALALLSKTVTATLPAALLVVLWWRRGRIDWRRDGLPLAPFFGLGAAAGLFTAWVEATYVGARGVAFSLTLAQRLLLAPRALCFYAAKIVCPVGLTFFYPRWTIDASDWRQYLFVAVAIAAAVIGFRMRSRAPLAAYACFAITLFPALGFLNVYPFRYSFVADHFAYLATLALVVPAAALLARLPRAVPAVLLCLLAYLTYSQAALYADEQTLYRATIERNPAAWLAHNNLGNDVVATNREEAIAHFREAIRLNPNFWEAHLSLGNALVSQSSSFAEALAEYEIAARLAPYSERTQTNLGNALLQAGRIGEGVPHLRRALAMDPLNAEAHTDLGNALLQWQNLAGAIDEYEAAIRYHPEYAEAHNNLGRALAMSNRMPDAIAEFETAIRLRPGYASAHNNLGNALLQYPNRLADAIGEYRRAIELNPDFAGAHYNLATALQRAGDRSGADAEFDAAARLGGPRR